MANAEQITEGAALQTFVTLAKNAKGKQCTAIIQQALSAPNVFVFGELLELPNMQQLIGTEDAKFIELLKLFAYGTYSEYQARNAELPPITQIQSRKLQQLSIVTLSATSKLIPYAVLQKELGISELRELEDLIIEAIYQGLVQGKLDQSKKTFEVEFSMGRDVKPESVDEFINVLTNWSNQSELLLKTIKEKIQHANFMNDTEKKHKEEYEKRVETVKSSLKAAMESDSVMQMQNDFEGEGGIGFFGGKGGRNKSKGHRDHAPHAHPSSHRDNARRGM